MPHSSSRLKPGCLARRSGRFSVLLQQRRTLSAYNVCLNRRVIYGILHGWLYTVDLLLFL